MKVVHLITSLKMGGAETALFNMLKQFENKHEHIVIYFHKGPILEKIKILGIKTYQVQYNLLTIFRLFFLIKKIKPNLIHSALWSANILGRITSKLTKISLICDYHGPITDQGYFRNLVEISTINIPKQFIAVAKSVEKDFHKFISTKKSAITLRNKMVLIQNGIDLNEINDHIIKQLGFKKENLGFDKDDFIIGSVGRHEEIKSYQVLIMAFKIFLDNIKTSKAKLCLIGYGSKTVELKSLTKKLSLENQILFTGQRNDAFNFYPTFDCFALSSKSEGLSIALLEAMAFGLPLISTHNSSEHDLIIDGKNGFLVKPNNPQKLAETLLKFYLNPNLKSSMKKANLEIANSTFNIKLAAKRLETLYQKLK